MATDHRQLLLLLDELMKPISTVTIPNTTMESEQILTINLIFSNACERFHEANASLSSSIALTDDQPAYYRYLQIHLHIIEILLSQETAQSSSNTDTQLPLFSIQDESIVFRSLSFVVLLGLILHFDEGISLSLEKYLQNTPTSIHLWKLKCDLSHHDRMLFLNETLNRLMNWIENNPVTSSIVQRLVSHHLLELLLSHLQLLYSPNLKYSSKEYPRNHLENNLDYLKKEFSIGFIQQLILLNRLLATTINSPTWLRQKCGDLFTSILIDPNHQGVGKIFQIILESSSVSSYDRLYVSLAQILSTCPKQLSAEVYLQSIKTQILDLFHQTKYRPIINIALNQLLKKYPKLIEKEIFVELFRLLFVLENSSSTEIATINEWECFLNDLENLTEVPSNDVIRLYLLDHHLAALINLNLALEKSLSADRERFFRILIQLFSSIDTERSIKYFQTILFRMKSIPLIFHPEQSTTVCLTINRDEENDLEFFGQTICKILFNIENSSRLILQLFLHLLQSLITKDNEDSVMIWSEKEKENTIQQLLTMDVLKRILEYLTEHVNIVLDHLDDTIRVIQIILNKLTESYQQKFSQQTTMSLINENDDSSDDDVLQIVLTIVSLFITHYEQLSFENKQKLTSLYSSLKWIEEHHRSNEFRQLAHELSVAFLTFGAVKDLGSLANINESSTKKKILIEELNDNERDLRAETFSNAWACLHDSSLPIRAHGLILFRRLIERADIETLKKIDDPQSKLFEKFQEHLHAEDSYEYLAAINVLSALTNRYTEKILPILCDEYINQSQTLRKSEDQLKVGEILVKTTRLLGDISSKYASRLINTFLYASKQTDDSLYRASALSNLGQLCTVLKYSLNKDLVEILVALKSYLSIFESVEVRRSAILVCELLCQSLEQSTWLTIFGDQLTSFYQLIKHLYQSDRDDIVRLHAQLALEALNEICREYLQPSTKLEKQIRILS